MNIQKVRLLYLLNALGLRTYLFPYSFNPFARAPSPRLYRLLFTLCVLLIDSRSGYSCILLYCLISISEDEQSRNADLPGLIYLIASAFSFFLFFFFNDDSATISRAGGMEDGAS